MFGVRYGTRCLVFGSTLAAGCQSVEPQYPIPNGQSTTALYPGIPAIGERPRLLRTEIRRSAKANSLSDSSRPSAAQFTDVTGQETIDLGVALRLAGIDNPTIGLAREAVRESLAGQLAARSLLLPSVNIGGNFRQHSGVYLAAPGLVRSVDVQSLYLGAGAGAVGAGTPNTPGVRLFAHLGDAAYEPLAARQRVTVRRSEAQAVQNAVLLDVATAYLELVGAEGRLDILRQSEAELAELSRLTTVYAKAGQGRQADAKRAEANLELLHRDIHKSEEEVAVASARLCGLLTLDPSVRLRTPGGNIPRLRLVPETYDDQELVTQAIQGRPEVLARSAAIGEAQTRVKQERVRPWLPTLSIGYSYAGFGGGSNQVASDFGPLKSRNDFDVVAVWTVENLGLGTRARVRQASATLGASVAEFDRITNQIRREVAESLAMTRAAARQIETATTSLSAAEEGFRLESERIRQGEGRRPIETLDSFRQLLESRQELLRAVIAFNVAQFRLFVAVGQTPNNAE